jgi:hypothetical protein
MGLELAPDFKEFLNLLRVHDVEYLLIGAYAVGYHGYPRATRNLDVWIAATPDNAERVVKTLRDFGFNTPDLSIDLIMRPNTIVRIGEEPLRIEIMNWASGVTFEECYEQKVVGTLDGVKVTLISLDHLKVNKEASGRLKDLSDVEHLP